MSDAFNWKPDQLAALQAGGDLVITASAGTGKTFILVAKFIRELFKIIRDTPRQELQRPGASPLNRMVAITFTELAAAQLKREIRLKLSPALFGDFEKIEQVFPDEAGTGLVQDYQQDYIATLIRELDASYIGTIHSFCRRILRENFFEAGISPSFGILAELTTGRADELQLEAANEALQTTLESDEYLRALAAYSGYSSMRSELIHLADELRTDGYSSIDPDSICAELQSRWIEAGRRIKSHVSTLLRQMSTELAGLGHLKPSKTNQPILDGLSSLILAAAPFIEDAESLLSAGAGDVLEDLRGLNLLKGNDFSSLNQFQKAYRELYDNGIPNDCPALKTIVGISADEPNIRSLMEAVRIYNEIYEQKKDALDLLDFSDLLLRARDLLRDNEHVRERYHRQFTHIFVDEFQDVDPLQHEIIGLLHKPGPGRALVVVGDGKQSIYRFRGADVLSFEDIAAKVSQKGGKQIQLETNFRSNAALIRAFNPLFGHLFEQERKANRFQMERADMIAHYLHEPGRPAVEWLRLEDYDAANEGVAIVKAILRLTDGSAANRNGKPLGFGDVAVLLTTYSNLTVYEDALRRHSIPYAVEGGRGFFRQREIWDIASYLKMLWFPQDDYSLAAVLRSPLCLLSDETLLLLAQQERLDGVTLFDGGLPPAASNDETERFESLKSLILRHRSLLDRLGTAEIIEELLEKTAYEAVLLSRAGGDQSTANVRKFIELARDYESSGVNSGLQFVLDVTARMLARDTDLEPQAGLGGAAEGFVRILTIHKSKGLQFPAVVIPQLKYGGNRPTGPILYDRYSGLGLKRIDSRTGKPLHSPSWNSASVSINLQLEAEHLRLLYVAMTRAQEHVVLIGSDKKSRNIYVTPWERRLEEARQEAAGLEENLVLLSGSQLGQIDRKAQSPADLHPEITASKPVALPASPEDAGAGGIIDRALKPAPYKPRVFSCNVHTILELLGLAVPPAEKTAEPAADPEQEIAEDSALLAPGPLETGRAVHRLLESIDLDSPPPDDKIGSLLRRFGLDGETDETARLLSAWLNHDDAAALAALPHMREQPFTVKLQHDDLTLYLSGTIDLLAELDGGRHWIVDYKFASPSDNPAHPKQLLLYALALAQIPGMRPQRASLVYLKEPSLQDVPLSEDALTELKQKIFARINQEWCKPGSDGAASP